MLTLQSNIHLFSVPTSYTTLLAFEPAFICFSSRAKSQSTFEDTIYFANILQTANKGVITYVQETLLQKRFRYYTKPFTCCFWYAVSGWILDSNNNEPENVNIINH
jgi:membrane protein required for beta-lactamase induction